MKYDLIAVFCVSVFVLSASSFATTIYVDDNAPNDPGPGDPTVSDPLEDGNESHPYDAIQEALDAAISGVDSITVKDGTYTGKGNADLDSCGKAIALRSENGADNTIIDCVGYSIYRGFNFHSGEGLDSVVDGFTIRGGWEHYGGGIHCDGSGPTITNCVITENASDWGGGGIACRNDSSPIISNCKITQNWNYGGLDFGGGIYVSGGSAVITNCEISMNAAFSSGGGIYCGNDAVLVVENCVISGNTAYCWGGGIGCCFSETVLIRNCIITGNSVEGYYDGGGIYCEETDSSITNCTIANNSAGPDGGGVYSFDSTLTNCIIWDNSPYDVMGYPTLNHCDIKGGWSGSGSHNIDQKPQFVGGGDYHISSTSACINRGDPSLDYEGQEDIDGDARVLNGRVDIGADECYATRTLTLSTPGNGKVRVNDGDVQTMPATEIFDLNEVVKVEAVPDEGYVFSHWSDRYNGINNPALITMSFDRDVTVDFKVEGTTYIYVNDTTGDDSYDGLAREWDGIHGPKKTIQAGINATVDGPCYTVLVADGTYRGEGNRDIQFGGKGTTLKSENGPASTIIDCEGTAAEQHRGFFFAPGDEADSVVDGFTIQNGYGERGSGVYCMIIARPTIIGCNITGNTATEMGGGIYCMSFSSPAVVNCTITANSAGTYGGGIGCEYGFLNITNCLITGNSADKTGGGIADAYSSSVITNCTIACNTAGNAGGGVLGSSNHYAGPMTDCVLWGNTPDQISEPQEVPLLRYCDVQGGWPGEGNIDADPLFVSGPEHDYYLSQITAGQAENSPCVDAGSDYAANLGFNRMSTRTDGAADTGIIDMGYHDPYALQIDSIARDGDGITIHWNAREGVSYVLDISVDLSTWCAINVGQTSGWTHHAGGSYPQIYYRVREQ